MIAEASNGSTSRALLAGLLLQLTLPCFATPVFAVRGVDAVAVKSASSIEVLYSNRGDQSIFLPHAKPYEGSSTLVSTPAFWWPKAPSVGEWIFELEVKSLDSGAPVWKSVTVQLLNRHWLNFANPLAPADYRWRAEPKSSTAALISTITRSGWNHFKVLPAARSWQELLIEPARTASQRSPDVYLENLRPRVLVDTEFFKQQLRILNRAPWLLPNYNPAEFQKNGTLVPLFALNQITPALEAAQRLTMYALARPSAEVCGTLIATTRSLLGPALSSVFSFAANDMAARALALTYSLILEGCSNIDSPYREQALAVIKGYLTDSRLKYVSNNQFAGFPHDSHGWTNLGYLCAVAALNQRNFPEASGYLNEALPVYLNTFSPWGGEDGGFGNASAYAFFAVKLKMPIWDILRRTGAADLYEHPWLVGMHFYLNSVYPPGAISSTFGDASELPSDRAVLDDLEKRTANSVLRSSVENHSGDDSLRWFESVGEVRFQTKTANPIQIYFRASPYGSFNHSHPDQNAIIANVGGQRVIGRSGTYDAYDSDHYRQWYKTTAAQSALTFGAAGGQTSGTFSARGFLRTVGRSGDTSWALGSAHLAYPKMQRVDRLVVVKELGQWLTLDIAETKSKAAVIADYNLHVPNVIPVVLSPNELRLKSVKSEICIRTITPFREAAWRNEIRDTAKPLREQGAAITAHYTTQWEAGHQTALLTWFDVGCRKLDAPQVRRVKNQWVLRWGALEWTLPAATN